MRALFAAGLLLAALLAMRAPANAIPIFAQRYALSCEACHTVLPELNAFGNAFRDRGYRLPGVPRHGTTVVALRYNLEWQSDPAPGSRRFTPSSSLLADEDIGAINAFLHYGLGVDGSPSKPFLGFLSYYAERLRTLFRLGLYELPLPHSPVQRLDDVTTYGYEGTTVGQNDLALNAPRLGLETERTFGATRLAASLAFGEFKGAAYGGAPVDDGTRTVAAAPELGLFASGPLVPWLTLNAQALEGVRSIALPGRLPFHDAYTRLGLGFGTAFFRQMLQLDAQQWLGRDGDADGSGDPLNSSGGYVRLKYFATSHFYVATRYDAQAAPFATRDVVFYVGTFVTKHARIVLQQTNNLLGGKPSYSGEFIVGVPWPLRE
ncbi:MAG: hypothetical protein ACLPSH_18715 [Vulcanimicrobiaceae bacterium]